MNEGSRIPIKQRGFNGIRKSFCLRGSIGIVYSLCYADGEMTLNFYLTTVLVGVLIIIDVRVGTSYGRNPSIFNSFASNWWRILDSWLIL